MLLELSAAEEAGVSLDVGFADELDCDGLTTLELEPGGTITDELELEALELGATEELEPGFRAIALELLPPSTTWLDEETCVGANGVAESSPQPISMATALAAHKELNKRFFIIFLFTPRLKLDFIARKGTKKSFLKAIM